LAGWKISEGSGRKISFPSILLGWEQKAVVEFSTGALNNDTDTIRLLDPAGNIIDEVVYGKNNIPAASDPNSLAKNSAGEFVVTETPTKGEDNLITVTVKEEIEETVAEKTSETEKTTSEETAETASAEEISEQIETAETVSLTEPPTIRLSELYPNTDGADATDEFIELENYGTTADLYGLTLKDAAGNSWTFNEHYELASGQIKIVTRNEFQFALNNSGSESVWLYAADNSLLDQTKYEDAPKKFSFARDGDNWRWTTIITPNEPNSFPETAELEDSSLVSEDLGELDNGRVTATKSPTRVSLAEARSLEKDSWVLVEGVVSAAPGTFSNQIFYLTAAGTGIQIYKSDANFPDLTIGDRVELSGITSTNRDEPRIKIGKDDTFSVLENSLTLAIYEPETIGLENAGLLVRLSGLITEKSSNALTIENDHGLVDVKIKDGTEIKITELKPGDRIMITGVVGQSEEKYFLLPRSQEDLEIEEDVETATTIATADNSGKAAAQKNKQSKALIVGSLAILGLIFYALRNRQRRNRKPYEKIRQLSPAPAR
ncbi:TPA: hypothetical protein DIC21_04740, partial [Candidatus Uhrbacteria bacterium]|nr:hypothetical protein [Candidatus Uhrbacteria bacterium]